VKSHVEFISVHAMRKRYDHQMSQSLRKATNQTHEKHENEVGEPFSDSGHVSKAARVDPPHILQSSIQHLHKTRKAWHISFF
jgi:hypothetical protein